MVETSYSKNTSSSILWKEGLKSLRSKTVSATAWVFSGYGLRQAIRLGANLILTRLLYPEVFGLMAIINVLLVGVDAVSDIGLRPSIVHNPRGDETVFLNTAWTIQILRGFVIWLFLCLCAWPAALFYEAPKLVYLIPIMGLVAVIQGFYSTSLLTLVRKISLRKKVIQELGSQIPGVIIMVVWALIQKSIWALVVGDLIRTAIMMIWSHFLIPGYRNRFRIDREAAKAIIRFGKWIFLSTSLTFLFTQGDRIVLGKILTSGELGVYTIAFFLSQAIVLALQQLSGSVLFPVYTQLAKRGISDLRKEIGKIRRALMLCTLPPIWVIAIWGQSIVKLLYDDRYIDAGWMLQILAIRAVAQVVMVTMQGILLANGDSFRHMILQLSRVILMGIGMYIGFILGGTRGLLIGMTVASFVEYPIMTGLIVRYGAWQPRLDTLAFGLSTGVILLGTCLI